MAKEQMERKTALMRQLARAVITISEKGDIISTEIVPDFAYCGNYLVVIGPVRVYGQSVSQAVRLEVAFGPSVPYEEFRWKENSKKHVMRRRWYTPLADEELVKLAPKICEMIGQIIDSDLRQRKSLGLKKQIGKKAYRLLPRGAFIKVPDKPELLHYLLLAKNREGRNRDFLASFSQQVSYELKGLRHSHYSRKWLEAHKGVRILASKIRERYTKEQIEWILGYMKGRRAKYRGLLETIINRLELPLRKKKEWYERRYEHLEKKYGAVSGKMLAKCSIEVATHPKLDAKRKTLPKGYVCVEILPSRKLQQEYAARMVPVEQPEAEVPYHAEF